MVMAADGFLVPARDLNAAVAALSAELQTMPQVTIETTMMAHGRMAARTIFIPAGTLLTGVLVNHDNICIVSGDITVTTIDGAKRITGYQVLPSAAGYRRAGIAHADTWWTCLWHTDLTDPIAIEDDMSDEANRLQTRLALENHPEN